MSVSRLEASTGGARLVSPRRMAGVSLISLAYFGMQGLLFVMFTPWLLRAFGSEVYGLWCILMATMGLAGLGDLGARSAVVKYTAQFSASDDSRRGLSTAITCGFVLLLLTGLLAAAILYLARVWIVRQLSLVTVPASVFSSAISITALGLVPFFLSQLFRGILIGLIRNEIAGGITLAQQVTLLGGALAIASSGGDIVALALWTLLINSMTCVASAYFAWRVTRPYHLRLAWDRQLSADMTRYSLVSWSAEVGSAFFGSADRILVGMLLGPIAAGAYAIATGAAMKINQLVAPVTDLLMPFASSYQAAGQNQPVHFAFRYGSRLTACLLVGAAGVLVLWTEAILSVWISPEFSAEYSPVFRTLIICYATFSMASVSYQMSRGLGWLVVPGVIVVGAGLAMLLSLAVLAPPFGLPGAAVANCVYVSVLGINFYVAGKLGLGMIAAVFKPIGPPLLVLVLLAIAVHVMDLSIADKVLMSGIVLVLMLCLALAFQGARDMVKRVVSGGSPASVGE